jgi:hypothetical protein
MRNMDNRGSPLCRDRAPVIRVALVAVVAVCVLYVAITVAPSPAPEFAAMCLCLGSAEAQTLLAVVGNDAACGDYHVSYVDQHDPYKDSPCAYVIDLFWATGVFPDDEGRKHAQTVLRHPLASTGALEIVTVKRGTMVLGERQCLTQRGSFVRPTERPRPPTLAPMSQEEYERLFRPWPYP